MPEPSPSPLAHTSTPRPGRSRLATAALVTATVFGLLFGLTAPSESPVTPTPALVAASTSTDGAPTVPSQAGIPQRRSDGGGAR